MDFGQATKALNSPRQKAMLKTSDEIDKALGLNETSQSVIGAWSDGAENSTMAELPDATWDQIRLSAAMKGFIGDQKAVSSVQAGRQWSSHHVRHGGQGRP